eukprot:1346464-Amorphochlora_amoeboformis.AAC.1
MDNQRRSKQNSNNPENESKLNINYSRIVQGKGGEEEFEFELGVSSSMICARMVWHESSN